MIAGTYQRPSDNARIVISAAGIEFYAVRFADDTSTKRPPTMTGSDTRALIERQGLVPETDPTAAPDEDDEPTVHYHVVCFIDGCLNDYDSGPYDTLEDARVGLAEYINSDPTYGDDDNTSWTPAGVDRYVDGTYILKIESCTEADCSADDN